MAIPATLSEESRGYDPYNHVGKMVRRVACWRDIKNLLQDQVLIMDTRQWRVLNLNRPIRNGDTLRIFGWDVGLESSRVVRMDGDVA